MTPIVHQLHQAWVQRGWSARELLSRARLTCDRTSMGRKIRGQQSVTADELEAIARALDMQLLAVPTPAPRKKRAA